MDLYFHGLILTANCVKIHKVFHLFGLRIEHIIFLWHRLLIFHSSFYGVWHGSKSYIVSYHMDHVKRIWYLSPMRAAKVQASLSVRAVLPEPSLLAHTSSESRGTFRQKIRSLAPLNGWACAVEICNDGMLEGTNSLDGAHMPLGLRLL